MDLYDALRFRRSAKQFGPQAPNRGVLERILQAATWAPNHRLTEPWRFFVLQGDARAALGEAIVPELDSPKAVESLRAKVVRAPVLIVVAQRGVPANPELALEDYGATCAAVQNLLLAAHAEGLAAKWSTGEMATSPAALAHLGLGEGDRIVALVYLGSGEPGAAPVEPKRAAPVVDWRH
ncbi:MAG: nitroreductase [Dehalococcoidia bacterium]